MLCVRQIIASASNAYDIPWPSNFNSFLSTLRIFLVDVVSITRTSCAQPMNYYASLATVLVGVKVVLLLMLLGPWLFVKIKRRKWCGCTERLHQRAIQQKVRVPRGFDPLLVCTMAEGCVS